ncbi:Replicase polyprotein 1ab [Gossypium arboreum]|uniref:Replicase polyprotein 1ab n=1 Tax=Gossypium arboreum TaxID=29729 RepID=A0A0B0PRM1_GOSAR|nr:Replicase polyprotein 1ab [Gossypium arboreum]
MASQPFTKKLTATDINKRLAIPGKILPSLPAFNGGHAVRIQLMYGTVIWPIDCTVRKNGTEIWPIDCTVRKNGTEIWPIDCTAVILSVMLLHFTGFFVGYISATICSSEKQSDEQY